MSIGKRKKNAFRVRKRRIVETEDERRNRLEKSITRNVESFLDGSPLKRENRLSGITKRMY